MKSGMIAAETLFAEFKDNAESTSKELEAFTENFNDSWVYKELHASRNFGPAMHKFGTFIGAAFNFIDQNLVRGKMPFTLTDNTADHETLKTIEESKSIDYPKPDGKISFDKPSSVFLSNTNHEEDQPVHLTLANPDIPLDINLPKWNEPAQRYCPAGVYEIVEKDGEKKFQINSQNCVHCKTCDIKDPSQNITWVVPEGGGGPNYPNM